MRRTVDYAHKRFSSPASSRQTRRRNLLLRRFLQAVGFAVVLLGVANFGPIVSRMPLAEVRIEGLKLIASNRVIAIVQQQMESHRWLVLPQRFSPFFNVREARERLLSEFPFANWSVDTSLFGGVSVAVQERNPVLVWSVGGRQYYVDDQGTAFAEVRPDQVSTVSSGSTTIIRHQVREEQLPVVVEETDRTIRLGDQPITAELITVIKTVVSAVQSGAVPRLPTITGYRYDPPTARLTVETSTGYVIYLDVASPLNEQLGKLTSVLGQGIGKRPGLKYIDLRYGQKVFYQ